MSEYKLTESGKVTTDDNIVNPVVEKVLLDISQYQSLECNIFIGGELWLYYRGCIWKSENGKTWAHGINAPSLTYDARGDYYED